MKFKRRKHWKQGRSILEARSKGGQIIWKGEAPAGEGDVFLVRLGKDAARQVVGTKHDAEAELRRLELEVETEAFRPGKTIRLDTFLEKHYLPAKRRTLKPSSFGECARTVTERISPALGRHQVQALATEHVQAWVDSLWRAGLSRKTVRNYTSTLRAALKLAVNQGLIARNPAAAITIAPPGEASWIADPFAEKEDGDEAVDLSRVWTRDEMQRFVEVAPADHEMTRWVILGLRTGLRPGEQCGLRWDDDVDLERGTIHVVGSVIKMDKSRRAELGRWRWGKPKTRKSGRDVMLPPDAVQALRDQRAYVEGLLKKRKIGREQAAFVFPSAGEQAYNNPDNMKDRLKKFIDGRKDRASAAGLPGIRYIPPYGLRHTHATDLLRNGWKTFAVAKRLGTSIAMIEKHYGHLLPDMEEEYMGSMTPLPGLARADLVVMEGEEAAA